MLKNTLIISALLSIAPLAHGAGDAQAGKNASVVCQGCHGEDGNSINPDCPTVAGQHPKYLAKQLKNFIEGKRDGTVMPGMAAMLSAKDIEDVTAYFSTQKAHPAATQADAETVARGKKIFQGGNRYSDLPACAGCHGPNGSGNPAAAYPALWGLSESYVLSQLNQFKKGTRANDPNAIMRNIAEKITENEMKAVAAYITTLSKRHQ